MKPRKFRPKSSEADSVIGARVRYLPETPPLEAAARDQRSYDAYDPTDPLHNSMRDFYVKQREKHEALASRVGETGVVRAFMGQSGSWPPLFQIEFSGGLTAMLGSRDLYHPQD